MQQMRSTVSECLNSLRFYTRGGKSAAIVTIEEYVLATPSANINAIELRLPHALQLHQILEVHDG